MSGSDNDNERLMAELRRERDHLLGILQNLPDMLFEVDEEGRFHNYYTARHDGLVADPEQFLGKTVVEILPASVTNTIMDAIGTSVKQGRGHASYALEMPDGTHWFEAKMLCTNATSDSPRIVALVRDVSKRMRAKLERRKMEKQLRVSEHYYRQLVEAAPQAIVHLSLDQKILFINSAAASKFTEHPGELVGAELKDVLPDLAARLQRVIDSGRSESHELSIESALGSRWYRATMHPIRGEDGIIDSVLVIADDITDVKEASSRFGMILESVPTALILVDERSRIQLINAATEALLGYSRDELVGQLVDILIPHGLRDGHAGRVQGFFQRPAKRPMRGGQTLVGLHKDGRTVPLEIGLSPLTTAQGTSVLASLLDVSERQSAMDVMARAMELKDEFLASMSHELRTPLGAILGVTEALQEHVYGPLSAATREPLQTIDESARHLLSLVDEVLDLSRLEAGQMEIQCQELFLDELCADTIRIIRPQAAAAGLRLATSDDGRTAKVLADPLRLKQILLNLLSNAVKFTAAGGNVSLEIGRSADDSAVTFVVRDTGPGIAEDKLDLLFKPFVQIEGGLNRHHKGSGLGLALSAHLARLHGGRIEVESELGRGSAFTLFLPTQVQRGQTNTRPSSKTGTAVLVEDSAPAAKLMEQYLRELGLEVTILDQARDAFATIECLQPSIVVLDLLLPDGSGMDVLKALKQSALTRHLPVLVASIVDESARSLSAGAALHLTKPFTRNSFESAVRQCTSSKGGHAVLAMEAPLVLIVDDTATNVVHVRDYLQSRGWGVETAQNGPEAIDKARSLQPQAILMDIQMPGMDGLEAIAHLRSDEETRGLFVVAVTGLALSGDRQRCLAAGADDYLAKPYSLRGLSELLAKVIARP